MKMVVVVVIQTVWMVVVVIQTAWTAVVIQTAWNGGDHAGFFGRLTTAAVAATAAVNWMV